VRALPRSGPACWGVELGLWFSGVNLVDVSSSPSQRLAPRIGCKGLNPCGFPNFARMYWPLLKLLCGDPRPPKQHKVVGGRGWTGAVLLLSKEHVGLSLGLFPV
jgi:hypothetical protein